MRKINNGILTTNIPHCIFVQTSTSYRFQRQHCEKIQTKSSPLSRGVHVRRFPFQHHPHRSTRLRNVNARKSKQKKDIWFQRKKVRYIAPYFKHYQTFKGTMASTGSERLSDTVRLKHHVIKIPYLTPPDRIMKAA